MPKVERVRLTEGLIDRYLTSAKIDKMAENTKSNKRRTLAALQKVMDGKNTCDLTADDIDATLRLLKAGFNIPRTRPGTRGRGRPSSGRGETSLNVDRSNLRQFVKWLQSRNLLSKLEDPCEEIELVGDDGESLDSLILTDDEVREGFVIAGLTHPRDRAVWALGIYLCQRESEILDLKWKDLHLDTARPYVNFWREKQNKWHKLYLPPALVEEMLYWRKWVEERHGRIQPDWYVIPGRPSEGVGTKMHPEWPIDPAARCTVLARVIQKVLLDMGIQDVAKKGVHTLRRTGACKLYELSQDLKLVKDWLGHSDIRTTMRYLRYSDADKALREAAKTYDPYGMAPEVTQTGEDQPANVVDLFSKRRAG